MHYDPVSLSLDFARLCLIVSFTFLVNCEVTQDQVRVIHLASSHSSKLECTHTHTHRVRTHKCREGDKLPSGEGGEGTAD